MVLSPKLPRLPRVRRRDARDVQGRWKRCLLPAKRDADARDGVQTGRQMSYDSSGFADDCQNTPSREQRVFILTLICS
jgi:hypothetical protein